VVVIGGSDDYRCIKKPEDTKGVIRSRKQKNWARTPSKRG